MEIPRQDLEAAKNILYGVIGDGLDWNECQCDIEYAIKQIDYVMSKYRTFLK